MKMMANTTPNKKIRVPTPCPPCIRDQPKTKKTSAATANPKIPLPSKSP